MSKIGTQKARPFNIKNYEPRNPKRLSFLFQKNPPKMSEIGDTLTVLISNIPISAFHCTCLHFADSVSDYEACQQSKASQLFFSLAIQSTIPQHKSRYYISRNETTVNVRNPNVQILALLYIVRLLNSSAFRRCLKSELYRSVIRRSVC